MTRSGRIEGQGKAGGARVRDVGEAGGPERDGPERIARKGLRQRLNRSGASEDPGGSPRRLQPFRTRLRCCSLHGHNPHEELAFVSVPSQDRSAPVSQTRSPRVDSSQMDPFEKS